MKLGQLEFGLDPREPGEDPLSGESGRVGISKERGLIFCFTGCVLGLIWGLEEGATISGNRPIRKTCLIALVAHGISFPD